jgi:hypothetical protein
MDNRWPIWRAIAGPPTIYYSRLNFVKKGKRWRWPLFNISRCIFIEIQSKKISKPGEIITSVLLGF